MKTIIYLLVLAVLTSCASTRVNESWTNKDYNDYQPKKVLIVGLTDNLSGRTVFEEQLQQEFTNRGVEAVKSLSVFKPTFMGSKQTEAAIEEEIQHLSEDGFDAVLISVIKGIDEKVAYNGNNFRTHYYWTRFGRYYYLAQDVFLTEGYYNKYKVYHIEASLYNLKENNDKSLVWVATYDVVDPQQVNTTVRNYIKAILYSLEKEGIINSD